MTALISLKPAAIGVVLLLCLVALPPTHAAKEHLPAEGLPGQPPAPSSLLASVDVSRLDAARTEVLGEAAAMLPLNLFDNWSFVFERVAETRSGYALSGRLSGRPLSSVTVVVNGDVVAGMVNSDDGMWHVRSRGAGVVEIRKLEGTFRCDAGSSAPFAGQPLAKVGATDPAGALPAAGRDDGDEIDVLVVFTEAARRWDGGFAQIRANIDLAVAVTNEAYRVSDVKQRLNLVGAVQIDYRESTVHGNAGLWNQREDLDRLRDESDGYMDDVLILRDSYAADIVYLIVDQPGGGGKGNILSLEDPDPAARAFAISNSLGDYIPFLAHELGHVMGLRHDRYVDPSNAPYPYSHGYVNQKGFADAASDEMRWHTIMAYWSQCSDADIGCREIMRFSNPNQRYPDVNGDPLGVPGDEPSDAVDGPADAVRSLNKTRAIVANFRPSSTRCVYALSRTEHTVAAGGGSFSIRISGETRCGWRARAHDGFLSLESSDPQRGNGDVAYTVAPNQGTARIGLITVAGETLVIYQSGATATTSVCDRTAAVRDAIVVAAKRSACSAVTEFDLVKIGSLDLSRKGVTALKAGDFDGLTNLAALDLSGNRIASLPESVFRDLTKVRKLVIHSNRLVDLPVGIFAGLSELNELNLSYNVLSALPFGVFSGLTKLNWLRLKGNKLRTLPDGIFSDLGHLRYLVLTANQLSDLRKEMFEGLTLLYWLYLAENPLNALPEDLFADIEVWVLNLRSTQLSEIPPRLFRNLRPGLWKLFLHDNKIATLPPNVFPGGNIEELEVSDNLLHVLPDELFLGFTSEFCTRRNMHLNLRGNPGSPFPLELELVRLDAGLAADGPASIAARVASSTPLPLTVGLSAPGGRLSDTEVTVPNGSVMSEPVEVAGDGPVTIRLVGEPEVPVTYKGITIVLDEPLRLFALADQTLDANGEPFMLDLAAAIAPRDGAESYAAVSANDAVALATVEDSTLIVRPIAEGKTTVTVTANKKDGSAVVRTFSVTVNSQATPDFNGDGEVDLTDFLAFASKFGKSRGDGGYESRFDLDGDGAIGLGDFLIFAEAFGKPSRPTP